MNDKSYVTTEQHRCLACGKDFDSGALLLDTRLRQRFERHTVTGWGLCSEHKKDGFVTLIACANVPRGDRLQPEDADRTGEIAMVKHDAWAKIFNVPMPAGGVAFVEPEVLAALARKRDAAAAHEVTP